MDTFISGSCIISIDVVADNDYDIFPLLYLAREALYLAEDCMKYRPHLDSKVITGTKHVLKILIFGWAGTGNSITTTSRYRPVMYQKAEDRLIVNI